MGNKENKSKKIWKSVRKLLLGTSIMLVLNFFGLFGLLKDFYLYLEDFVKPEAEEWVSEYDDNTRGILLKDVTADNQKPLTISYGQTGFSISRTDLILGTDEICLSDYIPVSEENCLIEFDLDETNHLLVSGKIFDTEQCLMITIDKGKFILSPECTFTYNKDEYGFEIVDSKFNVVLSMDSVGDNVIAVKGAFVTEFAYVVFSNQSIHSSSIENVDLSAFNAKREGIKRIFGYYGRDWFGKRVNN